jgi:hypothetical protein
MQDNRAFAVRRSSIGEQRSRVEARMKKSTKTRGRRGVPSGTRAGTGGRKQAQAGPAADPSAQDVSDAGIVPPPHPARSIRGSVEAGSSAESRGGDRRRRPTPSARDATQVRRRTHGR